jgi:chlorophyllide a reductase subunit Y
MTGEIRYDSAAETPVSVGSPGDAAPVIADGMGCHAGAAEMAAAARAAGNSDILDQYAADYPQGPHDKPQSMCPAFGSLRVGLRMRRVATVLSGSACCVYGLTFVSHFYGARRSVGYVPFNSESLVTGKLFEDIRDAVHELADPERYDAVVITNLCVPTASGVPLKLLPNEINGVRIVGIDVPGFGVPTHAEAKDVLAGAMLKYARAEIEAGPVAKPLAARSDRPAVALLGEMFPADPMMIGAMLAPMGLAAGPVVPCREWRELYAAPRPSANFRRQGARSSVPRPWAMTAPPIGWPRLATPIMLNRQRLPPRRTPFCLPSRRRLRATASRVASR